MLQNNSIKSLGLIMSMCVFTSSCINDLLDTDPESEEKKTVSISAQIQQKEFHTVDDEFEVNDSIGLYITIPPSTLSNSRFADNIKFTYSKDKEFIPDATLFFPEESNVCDFISYYPYRDNAIPAGKSSIDVEVQTKQTSKSTFYMSDFLVAKSTDISPSNDPVDLTFRHKLCRLNLQIKPENGYTVEALLIANPEVKITNLFTKAAYDFSNDQISNLRNKTDITPFGTWYIENDMLCGKSAIIIPQPFSASETIMELTVGNKTFTCSLDEDYTFESGIAEDHTLYIRPSQEAIKSSIRTSIEGWQSRKKDLITYETPTVIYTSNLNFTSSNVQKVIHRGQQVAEICEEYLLSDAIDKQAIVIYPVKDGVTDLTQGLVIKLIDETGEKHGGKVEWNKATNTLKYTEGNTAVIEHIYISESKGIVSRRPEDALQLQLQSDILTDSRDTEYISYPIVKIGTQYWLRGNLKTARYNNGDAIERGDIKVETSAQYYQPDKTPYYFYNSVVIATGLLPPNGWRISTEQDWGKITSYVKGNAAVLKGGISWGSSQNPVTNLSELNIAAVGLYNKTYGSQSTSGGYWSTSNTNPKSAAKYFTLSILNNSITTTSSNIDMAMAIRLVRE